MAGTGPGDDCTMAKKQTKKGDGEAQPKVFQISEKDIEDLLKRKDEIEAGVQEKPKAKSRRKKKTPGIDPEEVEALRKKAEERDKFVDRLQRLQAEYSNFQKRIKREKKEWADQSAREFLSHFLPLLDDFDGARRPGAARNAKALIKGIEILRSRLWKILSDWGVEEIPTDGKHFDPKLHEAITQEYSSDAEDGSILDVIQKGYSYKEWIIRPTRVRIARKGGPPPAEGSPQADTGPGESASGPGPNAG